MGQRKRYFVRYTDAHPWAAGERQRVAGPYRSEKRAETAKNCILHLGSIEDIEIFYEFISDKISVIQ